MPDRLQWVVITAVTAVWIANFAAGLVLPGYEAAESINGIFMGIVGGAIALSHRSKGERDE